MGGTRRGGGETGYSHESWNNLQGESFTLLQHTPDQALQLGQEMLVVDETLVGFVGVRQQEGGRL